MKLNQSLEGKYARVVTTDNQVFEGIIEDYIYPEDNDPEGVAAIDMHKCPQRPGQWIGFNETDIKSVEILEKEA